MSSITTLYKVTDWSVVNQLSHKGNYEDQRYWNGEVFKHSIGIKVGGYMWASLENQLPSNTTSEYPLSSSFLDHIISDNNNHDSPGWATYPCLPLQTHFHLHRPVPACHLGRHLGRLFVRLSPVAHKRMCSDVCRQDDDSIQDTHHISTRGPAWCWWFSWMRNNQDSEWLLFESQFLRGAGWEGGECDGRGNDRDDIHHPRKDEECRSYPTFTAPVFVIVCSYHYVQMFRQRRRWRWRWWSEIGLPHRVLIFDPIDCIAWLTAAVVLYRSFNERCLLFSI